MTTLDDQLNTVELLVRERPADGISALLSLLAEARTAASVNEETRVLRTLIGACVFSLRDAGRARSGMGWSVLAKHVEDLLALEKNSITFGLAAIVYERAGNAARAAEYQRLRSKARLREKGLDESWARAIADGEQPFDDLEKRRTD